MRDEAGVLSDLSRRFTRAWQGAGAAGDGVDAFAALRRRYSDPSRHYHTLDHIVAVLDALQDSGAEPARRAEAELAIWYHDAVHEPARDDNEAASAELAARELREVGVPEPTWRRVAALILDTRHLAPATSADGALVADADLAILAASPRAFDKYDHSTRLEYAFVSEKHYRAARAAVLQRLLDRPAIYQTDAFRQRHEAQARANLERAIQQLQQPAD